MRYKTMLAAAAAVALSWASAPAHAEHYPSMNLKFAHFVPATFPGSQVDQWFADELQKRSGGKIKVQIFWAESMGKAMELLELVKSGAVDMSATAQGYFPSQLPLVGMTNSVMMLFDNNEQAVRTTAELIEKSKAMQDELKRNNVYPLFFHSLNAYRPFCTKKIATIEDFKGLKMRSWGEYVPVLWQSLGATGVNVLTQEIYEALQRGTVDCAFWANDLVVGNKLYEVAKFEWAQHLGAIPTWPVWVNWKTYHEVWPPSVRKLMAEVGKEAMERDIKATREAELAASTEMQQKHGVQLVQFNDMDKLKAKVPDLLKLWVEKMQAKGLGKEATEIAGLVSERRAPQFKPSN
jgi:TRAP-type C4-dicarboxylate transport system substrate-binding protein